MIPVVLQLPPNKNAASVDDGTLAAANAGPLSMRAVVRIFIL